MRQCPPRSRIVLDCPVKNPYGFPPPERDVELPFVAFYRFDGGGKLSSERVVMSLGPLRD